MTNAVIRSPNITSDVRVYYNATTDQIEVEPMIVQGGRVELVGQDHLDRSRAASSRWTGSGR